MSAPRAGSSATGTPGGDWTVVCLCAAWCGVCRDYGAVFQGVAAGLPGARFAWVDVEDEAERIGDFDIETFPTLLVVYRRQVRFFAPLPPGAEPLRRLLASLASAPETSGSLQGEGQTVFDRLKASGFPGI